MNSENSTSEEKPSKIIQETIEAAEQFYPLAQKSFIYRYSIAYILQHIKSFIKAIKPLESVDLPPIKIQSLQRFIGYVNHFSNNILPSLNENQWADYIVQQPSDQVHKYIGTFRNSLIEICAKLELNPSKVIEYDPKQDKVNRNADFQHLKKVLREKREQAITVHNSIEYQQSIESKLRSIQKHLPKIKGNSKVHYNPSVDTLPMSDMQQTMDKGLSAFENYDIPCEDLRLDVALGCGGFGTVYMATRLSTAELLAVKEVRSDKLTLSTWASLYSEVDTMSELRHRYVLEFVGAHIKEPYRIITRYCPGKSLFDRLHRSQSSTKLTPKQLTMIAYQVAEGMRFLHEKGIVHRDLKTMNILLDKNDAAKIADFGLAGMIRDILLDKNEHFIGGVGTPHYTAPEVLDRKRYGPKVDVYSYGIILWEMAMNQIPFRNQTHQEIYDFVVKQMYRLPLNNSVPVPLQKLIKKCWSQNPKERPEFDKIIQMFKRGEIYFKGAEGIEFESLEVPEGCPPLDLKYLISILTNPSDDNFPHVVNFLEKNIDKQVKDSLNKADLISHYNAKCKNTPYILLVASQILKDNEFSDFIVETADTIINDIFHICSSSSTTNLNLELNIDSNSNLESTSNIDSSSYLNSDFIMESSSNVASPYDNLRALIAAARFCLRVPDDNFNLVEKYVPDFVTMMNQPCISPLVLRLLARLDEKSIKSFKTEIVQFFTPEGISQVNDQMTLDAICKLLPIVADKLSKEQLEDCIPLIEMDFDCPEVLIKLLVSQKNQKTYVRLVNAIIRAAQRTDVTDSLIEVLKVCESHDLQEIASNPSVFDQIKLLLEDEKLPPSSVESALILLFRLASDETVPPLLANHPLLHSVLQLRGHVAQRLQIFTALFSVEQFCSNTTISDGVLKLLVSSSCSNKKELIDYSMKLIGALSLHTEGCTLISVNGMLSIFSQMFLSSNCGEMSTALTILSNVATHLPEDKVIPQLSLIVSCLMQDLNYSSMNKSEVLHTLTKLIKSNPSGVQEHDLQFSVLPLLSPKHEPVIIVLALRLLDECDPSKLKNIFMQILQKIFNLLSIPTLMYPELLSAAINLVTTLAIAQYDLSSFIQQTDFINFCTDIQKQIEEYPEYEEISATISNCIFCLSQQSSGSLTNLTSDNEQLKNNQNKKYKTSSFEIKNQNDEIVEEEDNLDKKSDEDNNNHNEYEYEEENVNEDDDDDNNIIC